MSTLELKEHWVIQLPSQDAKQEDYNYYSDLLQKEEEPLAWKEEQPATATTQDTETLGPKKSAVPRARRDTRRKSFKKGTIADVGCIVDVFFTGSGWVRCQTVAVIQELDEHVSKKEIDPQYGGHLVCLWLKDGLDKEGNALKFTFEWFAFQLGEPYIYGLQNDNVRCVFKEMGPSSEGSQFRYGARKKDCAPFFKAYDAFVAKNVVLARKHGGFAVTTM